MHRHQVYCADTESCAATWNSLLHLGLCFVARGYFHNKEKRRSSCKHGHHSVIGPRYTHGPSDRVALLRSLPINQSTTNPNDAPSSECYGALTNRETRETQIEDPQQKPLPAGWRIRGHLEERTYSIFIARTLENGRESIYG